MSEVESLDAEIRRVCAILESVAATFPPESEHALAIRDAALAYTIVSQHQAMLRSYEKLKLALDGHLSEEMKADLRHHGIDPDSLDDEGDDL